MRVAFVSLYAYPLFEPRCHGIFGGSEVRAWTFARFLARRPDMQAAMIVLDHGQPARQVIDGVEIFRHDAYRSPHTWDGSDRPRNFSEVIRTDDFSLPRGITAALRHGTALALQGMAARLCRPNAQAPYAATRPDVLCVLGVSPLSVEAAEYCRRTGCRLVLMLGSDEDLSEHYYAGSREVNAYGSPGDVCYRALKAANAIVTQTEQQRALLQARFGLEGTTIRNPIEIAKSATSEGSEVLWIGKSDGVKRPDLFVRLAETLPGQRFTLVMNISDRTLFENIALALPPNLRLVERVPFQQSAALFARAAVLVNTSRFEGFPNTFLQAGAASVPIASLDVDPDGFVSREGCGLFAAGAPARLAADVKRLCGEPALRSNLGRRARNYVERHHAADMRAAELGTLLENVCKA